MKIFQNNKYLYLKTEVKLVWLVMNCILSYYFRIVNYKFYTYAVDGKALNNKLFLFNIISSILYWSTLFSTLSGAINLLILQWYAFFLCMWCTRFIAVRTIIV